MTWFQIHQWRRSIKRTEKRNGRLEFESLESRLVLATFFVDSLGDGGDADTTDANCVDGFGACTLRAAIEQSNALAGPDAIEFQIPGTGPHTIHPASPLPVITDPVVLDGTSQPGFAGRPLIELDGSAAGSEVTGLRITAGSTTVRGLVVNRFGSDAIALERNGGNVLEMNFIGTDVTGTMPMGNGADGVFITGGSSGNRVGTNGDGVNDATEGNVISGNGQSGIRILGAGVRDNVVAGNFIGTDVTGTTALGNNFDGVSIQFGAQRNRIGTNGDGVADEAERNIISASRRFEGVQISGSGTDFNVVAGNFIGTDVTGTVEFGSGGNGVTINGGARSNRIGTDGDGAGDAAERNVISGNRSSGVAILDPGSDNNIVAGNFIGTDVTGTLALGNTFHGLGIVNGAQRNRIGTNGDGISDTAERNVISATRRFDGVAITGAGTDLNVVAGNFIGTDLTGLAPLPNAEHGVSIFSGAQFNRIGSNADGVRDAEERNLISGNLQSGVAIISTGTEQNIVAGNFIGTDVTGGVALPNRGDGVIIFAGATGNLVGGVATAGGIAVASLEASRNIISGNGFDGVRITGSNTVRNVVQANFIGTDFKGTRDLGNSRFGVEIDSGASENTIGGHTAGAGNLISGNSSGVRIVSTGTSFNRVAGNLIGTEVTGTAALGNSDFGVLLDFDASSNFIGEGSPAGRNIISGNQGPGVRFASGARFNLVLGNFIGTDITGNNSLANAGNGVLIDSGATSNQIGAIIFPAIGGAAPGGNVIAGNTANGIEIIGTESSGNLISSNMIGTNGAGAAALGNLLDGVRVVDSPGNTIGNDFNPAGRNLISGNMRNGVALVGAGAIFNRVLGNFIGTDALGTAALGNAIDGVVIVDASINTIGGTTAGSRNVISGNGSAAGGSGVAIFGQTATGNQILGNFIGTDSTGTRPLGNFFQGVALNSPQNVVGGVFDGAANVISGNGQHGVALFGADAERNAILMNRIGTDPTGTRAIGNFNSGIFIENASNNAIGGFAIGGRPQTGAGPRGTREPLELPGGNTIAFNGHSPADAGILIAAGTRNTVFASNSVFANAGLGIDLDAIGVSPNDPRDDDTGANTLLNFPVLTSAIPRRGRITVHGSLNSTPLDAFIVHFFANETADPTNHGEGKSFLGSVSVVADGTGSANFRVRFRPTVPRGQFITATTIDSTNNTSEFSAAIPVGRRLQAIAAVVVENAVLTSKIELAESSRPTRMNSDPSPLDRPAGMNPRVAKSTNNSASSIQPPAEFHVGYPTSHARSLFHVPSAPTFRAQVIDQVLDELGRLVEAGLDYAISS